MDSFSVDIKIVVYTVRAMRYKYDISSTHGGRSWASALRGPSVFYRSWQPVFPLFPHLAPLMVTIEMIRGNQPPLTIGQLLEDHDKVVLLDPDVGFDQTIPFFMVPI
ncbi:MAG: hypothetical protein WAW42_04720 [Candidatus Competibacteraceae bacterium]